MLPHTAVDDPRHGRPRRALPERPSLLRQPGPELLRGSGATALYRRAGRGAPDRHVLDRGDSCLAREISLEVSAVSVLISGHNYASTAATRCSSFTGKSRSDL